MKMNEMGDDRTTFCRRRRRRGRSALIWLAAAVAVLVAAVGCHGGGGRKAHKPLVVVSVAPQAFFVNRIAGDRVDVEVLVPPEQDPHTYVPTAQQVAHLEHAAALFCIGMPFEAALVSRLDAAGLHVGVVDTNANLKTEEAFWVVRQERGGQAVPPASSSAPASGASGLIDLDVDGHTWLCPHLVRGQATMMAQTLEQIDPENAQSYSDNLAKFQADLDSLDELIADALEPVKGGTFYVVHPGFGYFAQAYGLGQEAIEPDGHAPSPARLAELAGQARTQGVRTIFIQRQYSDRSARMLADQIGAEVLPLDGMSPDYMNNLLDIAHKIQDALLPPAVMPPTQPAHRRGGSAATASAPAGAAASMDANPEAKKE
jgi:zinc transport system substrate-binding protein